MEDEPGQEKLGRWLQQSCQREGLSLREAGDKAGLSHSTIRDIINGTRPTPETIRKLARVFANGNGHRSTETLEDMLLVLAGHRTERQEKEISEPMARLLDIISDFSESQMKVMSHFASFLAGMESGK